MRIAFFGGAFDPPHTGHLAEARAVLQSGVAEKVWLVPSYVSPHKMESGMTPYRHRMAMAERLISGEQDMEVSAAEEELQITPCYTVKVLTALQARYPEHQFLLLIGGDSLRDLHRWYCAGELAEKFEIWTYPRPGVNISGERLAEVWPPEIAEKLAERCLTGVQSMAASSSLREELKAGRVPEGMLTAPVLDYIKKNNLYGGAVK